LGHDRRAGNLLEGSYDGRGFVAFDFVYRTTERTSGPNSTTATHEQSHDYSIIAISTGAVFPHLRVSPEGRAKRFFGRLTNSDIELESAQLDGSLAAIDGILDGIPDSSGKQPGPVDGHRDP
jgi:hypothetical protein